VEGAGQFPCVGREPEQADDSIHVDEQNR